MKFKATFLLKEKYQKFKTTNKFLKILFHCAKVKELVAVLLKQLLLFNASILIFSKRNLFDVGDFLSIMNQRVSFDAILNSSHNSFNERKNQDCKWNL